MIKLTIIVKECVDGRVFTRTDAKTDETSTAREIRKIDEIHEGLAKMHAAKGGSGQFVTKVEKLPRIWHGRR